MIALRTEAEIEKIARAGRIVALVLKETRRIVKPGITTKDLEDLALDIIHKQGAVSAFKDYEGYPAAICTSVNEQVVHAAPSGRVLKEGDIVSIDVGAKLDGYFADAAITCPVGRVSEDVAKLIRVTEKALSLAIKEAIPGNFVSDLSHAVEAYVTSNGFSIVREFVGHGIGSELHEEPQIPNFTTSNQGPQLKAGMVLAIEPMVNMGNSQVEILPDGWTAVAKDGLASAHFEHTIAVREKGNLIITK